jgi:vancomycin resistance protein YoaR
MARHALTRLASAIIHLELLLTTTCLVLWSALGLAWLAYQAHHAERIYQGVTVQGIPVGGLTPREARELVTREYSTAARPLVSLYTTQQAWTISLGDMGWEWDLETAIWEAWKLGRSGIFREDMEVRLRLLWQGYRIIPQFRLDPGSVMQQLRQIAKQTGRAARGTRFWVSGLEARTQDSSVGRELDIEATRQAIERELQNMVGHSSWEGVTTLERLWRYQVGHEGPPVDAPVPVALVFRELVPPFTEVTGAQEWVNTILSSPVTCAFVAQELTPSGDIEPVLQQWIIDQALLSSWLALERGGEGEGGTEVKLDADQVRAHVERLADEVARAPREARFDYDPAKNVLSVRWPGQNGYALDVDAAQALIIQACQSTEREVILPVKVIRPRVTRADLEAMLPLQLLSEGISNFAGSPAARLQNIKVASSRFNGLAVPAQSDFSFLQYLGPVTVANGYSEANIISGDRTVLGPGGGVCQVSTTCYRAAFWAGFPMLERSPHSYRIAWYEPPLGLDAAVFSPLVDLKFHNDQDTPFLVLTEVDAGRSQLAFRFYGKKDGRNISLEGPVTSNPVSAGEPVFDVDPSLQPGTRIQTERAHDGLDVVIYRVIKRGEEVLREEFFSRYQPWPARYTVGPSASQTSSSSQTGN